MIKLDLPETLEKHFWNVVRDSYDGDVQAAVTAFLHLHAKYGWKEQFIKDIQSIREEVHRQGGIKERVIAESVKKYREYENAAFPLSRRERARMRDFFQCLGCYLCSLPEQAKHGRSRTGNDTATTLHPDEQ